jgi:hypothetical protein
MKIQCPCGAKYSVDVTPEMAARPVQFICQSCGTDSSEAVNAMIRQELGQMAPVGVMIPSENEPAVAPPPPPRPSGPRIQTSAPKPESGQASTGGAPARQICLKHPGQPITHQCLVCNKPMCPKCMELFGYVCSPFCKSRAEAQRLDIPEYAGKTSVVESRFWRKFAFIAGSIAAVIVALLSVWFWYVWIGSHPSAIFAVRFEDGARTGQSQVCGQKQIVFLHGTTLYRYDMKTKKQVWARKLVDEKLIHDEVQKELQEMQTMIRKVQDRNPDAELKIPPAEDLIDAMLDAATGSLQLYVHGSNVWVRTPDKLVRCDWDSGSPLQEIPLNFGFGPLIHRGDELLAIGGGDGSGREAITHINLVTAQTRVEEIGDGAVLQKRDGGMFAFGGAPGGLPLGGAGADGGRPLDPDQVAAEVQKLPLAGKIALPALLSVQMNQQRALQEMRDQDEPKKSPHGIAAPKLPPRDFFSLIPSEHGYVEFSSRLLESRFVQRNAMKDPPKKSMIDGNLTASQSLDAANEILNEMQRNAGGATVTEDESRYRATVRVPGGKVPDWSAEVIGRPQLFPLPTVTVVAGGKSVVVLDKNNKKLWESPLSARIPSIYQDEEDEEGDEADTSHGPCVERDGKLYVFDQLVLTAFDLHTGNVQWRLPSVGVTGLFFDPKGKLYVNTTTAGPEAVKYARQIDVTQQTGSVVLKVDPATGKILWRAEPGGIITHVEGKFIYIVKAFQDTGGGIGGMRIIDTPSYLQIKRLNPDDGRVMWEHRQDRAPLDVKFHKNTIQLVFRKEVQVLRFLSF